MGQSLQIDIPVRINALSDVTTQIEEFCDTADIPVASAFKVNLVVQELVTNSVTHGDFGDREPEISLSINCHDGKVEMLFEDNAAPFDPFTETPAPDLNSNISDRAIGGLGIHLIRSFSDYSSHEHVNGRNRIRLVSPAE